MKNKPYKRKPGDFEIRILNSGKVVMITPDETLMEIAQIVEPDSSSLVARRSGHGRRVTGDG